MNIEEFKRAGTEVIDYLADYRDSVSERDVIPDEEPGFMKDFIPSEAPENPEKWEEAMQDLENYVIPGLVHWIHPQFASYFPGGGSNASFLALMLGSAINCTDSSWFHCPASTELEMIVLDWIARLYNLPDKFQFYKEGSKGGGTLQGSASECLLMCLLGAQQSSLKKLRKQYPGKPDSELLSLQTAYTSKEAHSSHEKNYDIALVNVRKLEVDDEFRLCGETLEKAIRTDIENGYHPFYCSATFGTTSCGAVDKIDELGAVCKKYNIWFHVDGAYGLAALSCPEFKHLQEGFENITSINTNLSKWLLVHYDCCLMWVEDRYQFAGAITDPSEIYEYPTTPIVDYHTWGVTDLRRFRSLKMWFVLRNYGVEGIQKYIRNHVALADRFDELVRSDDRFEVITKNFALVCFRMKGPNSNNVELLSRLTASQKLFMIPSTLGEVYVIRFCINNESANEEEVIYAWKLITQFADEINSASKSTKDTKQIKAT